MLETMREPRSFVVLDTFRGLAAFYVLLYHASAFLVAHRMVFGGILSWGVQVVLFFFVLSGFCIHYGQARALAKSSVATLDLKHFARRRFWRIYPPFLGALCLTFAVDRIGIWLYPAYYADLKISLGQLTREATWSSSTLLGNVLCFQPGVPTFGSNGPLWSLGYEAVFYVVYPFYFQLSRRLGPIITLVAVFGLSATSHAAFKLLGPHSAIPFGALSTWGIWAMGGALADIAANRISIRASWPTIVAGCALLVVCTSGRVVWPNATVQAYAWGAAWTLVIFWTSQSRDSIAGRVRSVLESGAWSGRISYSLYLAHAPVVTLLLATAAQGYLAEFRPLSRFGLAIAAGVAAGFLLYGTVERHFIAVRRTNRSPQEGTRSTTAISEPVLP